MKKIIFIIFIIFSTQSFAQVGLKAGYILKGYQAGITFQQQTGENKVGYFELELLYNQTTEKITSNKWVYKNGQFVKEEEKIQEKILTLPLTLKIKFDKKVSPILRWGFAPGYNLTNKETNLAFVIGSGIQIGQFIIDGRYLLPIVNNEHQINIALGVLLWK